MIDKQAHMIATPSVSDRVDSNITGITTTNWTRTRALRTAFFKPPDLSETNMVAWFYLSAENDTDNETTEGRIIGVGNQSEVLLTARVTGSGFGVDIVGPVQLPNKYFNTGADQRVGLEYQVTGGTGKIYDGTTLAIGPGVEQD